MKQPITNESGKRDGRKDFDFLIGSWKIQHRRLKERLKECTEWEEFEGTGKVRSILGGLGNMDELVMDRASDHVQAVTVRLYNPMTREWSIYWSASSNPGRMDVPMVGKFDGPRGEFYSQEVFEGRHIFNRFHLERRLFGFLPLGTGILGRWRQDLGDQLDHEVHPSGVTGSHQP